MIYIFILFLFFGKNKNCRMFYFFFESRNSKNDPVVIWLTGGPGCSSELALFYENGPFQISNNLSLVWNDYGWDKVFYFILLLFFCNNPELFLSINLAISLLLKILCVCIYIYLLQISNLIYVDQPTGTGFSYTSDNDDIRHDEQGVSNDLYDFLQVLPLPQNSITLSIILVPHRNFMINIYSRFFFLTTIHIVV